MPRYIDAEFAEKEITIIGNIYDNPELLGGEQDRMLSNDIKRAIANTNISKYRKILVKAINAHREMIFVSVYDNGFHYGMEHALYLLDQMCRNEWEEAKSNERI